MKILTVILSLLLYSQLTGQGSLMENSGQFCISNGRTTQYIGKTNTVAGMATYDNRIIYLMKDTNIIENTTDTISFFNDNNAVGTRAIPANVIRDGDIIRYSSRNIFTCTGNPTNIIMMTLQGDTIIYSETTLTNDHDSTYAEIYADIQIFLNGGKYYAFAMGRTFLVGGNSRTLITDFSHTGKEIDITQPLLFDCKYRWGAASASNQLISIMNILQILN